MATHLLSLKDSVLLLVLRHLARNELLRLRIASQELCSRLSTMMSDEQMARAICFERRLRMPASLDGVPDLTYWSMAAFLMRLRRRFRIEANTWALKFEVMFAPNSTHVYRTWWVFARNGMTAFEALAAIATTPLDIQLRIIAIGDPLGAPGASGVGALAPLLAFMNSGYAALSLRQTQRAEIQQRSDKLASDIAELKRQVEELTSQLEELTSQLAVGRGTEVEGDASGTGSL